MPNFSAPSPVITGRPRKIFLREDIDLIYFPCLFKTVKPIFSLRSKAGVFSLTFMCRIPPPFTCASANSTGAMPKPVCANQQSLNQNSLLESVTPKPLLFQRLGYRWRLQ